jgi:hypothetical protein
MKKVSLALLALIAGAVAYCSLPLTSVALLTVTVSDQDGRKISSDVTATYLDDAGAAIVTITPDTTGSWDNNLHWWAHSAHATSTLRPEDARRATSVVIEAAGCEAASLPVTLVRNYEPLSFAPHGGGAAYFIYEFEQSVVLHCR